MGSKLSKRSSSNSAIPAATLTTIGSGSASGSGSGSGSGANGDLRLYLAACHRDPDVQKFDSTLHQHAISVINTLAPDDGFGVGGSEVRSLSFDSLRQVAGCLMDMNQEVATYILKFKKDVWKNKELLSLVEDYFEYTVKTLDFFTSLDNCLRNARARQFIIVSALRRFEEELQVANDGCDDVDVDVDADACTKFAKTLEELRSFKEAGDPFGSEFFGLFDSVRKQQLQMLERLQQRRRKLDKKLKSVKVYRKVSSIIFVATFVAVVICSVVAAAVSAPPVAAALAAVATAPLGGVGKWVNSLWKRYEKELRDQKELIFNLQLATCINLKDLENIRVLVDRLEIEIQSLLTNVDFALRDADILTLVIDEIRKKLTVFMEGIDNLTAHSDKYSREIRQARTMILRRITE